MHMGHFPSPTDIQQVNDDRNTLSAYLSKTDFYGGNMKIKQEGKEVYLVNSN